MKEDQIAYDFKKEYKSLYLPKHKPSIIEVPAMTFVAVAGEGDPNEGSGAYQTVLNLLYGFSYTVKMSKKGDRQPDGTLISWFRPWRAFGGVRLACSMGLTSVIRVLSDGCLLSGSRIL